MCIIIIITYKNILYSSKRFEVNNPRFGKFCPGDCCLNANMPCMLQIETGKNYK